MRRVGIRLVGSLALLTPPRVQGRVAAPRAAGAAPVRVGAARHHAPRLVRQVEERDGDQVAVDDPYARLEEVQQLDAETREVADG